MQAFYDNARVQITDAGLLFYEKDILMSKYLFHGDLQVDFLLQYKHSGFGIVLTEDDNNNPFESNHKYLLHCGTNVFHSYEKHLTQQAEIVVRSNVLAPQPDSEIHMRLKYTGRKVTLSVEILQDGILKFMEVGSHVFTRKFSNYYIGFYSVAGNVIKDVTFLQGIPNHWNVSIANVHGGRISFWEDGFMFEDCIHDAELEQTAVTLQPGKYYFTYDTEEINGQFDIEGFIYDTDVLIPQGDVTTDIKNSKAVPTLTEEEQQYIKQRGKLDTQYFEDHGKNILNEDGSFELSHATNIVVSFKGMNGKVSHVCIKDNNISDFIATSDQPITIDGSWIEVMLQGIRSIHWEGIIYRIPPYTDYSQRCPYGIVVTNKTRVMLDALSVDLNEKYQYTYDVATNVLSSHVFDTGDYQGNVQVILDNTDKNSLKIFYNMKAIVNNLILTMEDGSEVNVNIQKTFKTLVPGYIKGPIIVTDEQDESFDLSASYREVVKDNSFAIDYFSKSAMEMKLSYHTTNISYIPEVVGISKGAVIDITQQTDISKFTTQYTAISQYTLINDILTVPDAIRDDYEYIAIKYQRADQFYYYFTTIEREIFDGTEDVLDLVGDVNESAQGITLYGILEEANYNEEYLLRVPNKEMIESIDLCTDVYDVISPTLYTVNTLNSTLKLGNELKNKYKMFIVDYTKRNSYAVNWDKSYQHYLVDIASDESEVRVHYELDDNNISSNKIRTKILSNENKFVILRRKKGMFLDED